MYIGARQKKKFLVFFAALVIFLIIGLGIFWVNEEMSEEFLELSEPKNVVLSNVGEDGVSVSWTTEVRTEGYLILYKDGEKIGEFNDPRDGGRRYTHYVDVADLSPNTAYEFEIFSSEKRWLNSGGELYRFATNSLQSEVKASKLVEGLVDGDDVLVFLMVDDLTSQYPLSTYVSDGKWSVDLSKFSHLDDFELRNDTPLKILFHSYEGTDVFRGNKNVLFEDGEFLENVEFGKDENIFLLIPDVAKFREERTVVEEEAEVVEVEEVEEIQAEEVEEEVLGAEDEESVEIEETEDVGVKLEVSDNLEDYGLY